MAFEGWGGDVSLRKKLKKYSSVLGRIFLMVKPKGAESVISSDPQSIDDNSWFSKHCKLRWSFSHTKNSILPITSFKLLLG